LVETVTMFLVLITALLLFYVYANNLFIKETEYSHYDDVVSVYNSYYIKEALFDHSEINTIVNPSLFDNNYGFIIGADYSNNLFINSISQSSFYNISNELNMHQMFLSNDIKNLKKCALDIDLDTKCRNTFLDEEFRSYIKTINLGGIDGEYYLILQFKKDSNGNTCTSSECFSYYSWVTL